MPERATDVIAPAAAPAPSLAGTEARFESPDFYDEVDSLDLANLDALDEAPSHAHDIEQKIKDAFPGTKFAIMPDPDDDEGEGGA